jgi:hypothetical protein
MGRFLETITIRPGAKTGNRSWPRRELNFEGTLNHRRCPSRFGENFALSPNSSFRRHFAPAKLIPPSLPCIGKCI